MTTSPEAGESRQAIQRICPDCLSAHYPAYINAISAGDMGCEFCTRGPLVMTRTDYDNAVIDARARAVQEGNRPEPGA